VGDGVLPAAGEGSDRHHFLYFLYVLAPSFIRSLWSAIYSEQVAKVNAADLIFKPSPASARGPDARIYVIFTNKAGTKAALSAASRLARGLDLPLSLLAARQVPYPLPLENPPVGIEFIESAMRELVSGQDPEITVHILLCRERDEALRDALGPDALVVLGTGNSWWKSRYRHLARCLKADGRRLILID
jgi:hypothetical protein